MPVRVCHIITRMVIGGAQENTLLTLKGLSKRGFQPYLITGPSPEEEGSLLENVRKEGIPCYVLPALVRDLNPLKDACALLAIYRLLCEKNFMIVHTHSSKAGVLGRVAAKAAKAPLIVHTPHGHVFHSYFSSTWTSLFLLTERALARFTDALIALTPTEMQEHLFLGVGKRERFYVIPSGVELLENKQEAIEKGKKIRKKLFPEGAYVVGTVARLVPIKGIPLLLDAHRRLRRKHRNLFLLLVGDGPERRSYERLAKNYSVEKSVVFSGFQRDVLAYLSAMDLFVLASLNEGQGKAVVQAAYMEKPVVASCVGGIKDLIQAGRTGLFFAPGDPRDLAQKLSVYLRSPQLAGTHARNLASALFPAYSAEEMVDRIAALYDELLKKQKL